MTGEVFEYSDGHDRFVGYLLRGAGAQAPAPGVLIAPAFGGLGPFEKARAEELAALGYVVLAVDYYGGGAQAEGPEQAREMMAAVTADRRVLAGRMVAALDALGGLAEVDAGRLGAMGYCLGGKAVLDLARSGAAFRACVPLHGVYDPPDFEIRAYSASVLVLHGWDDPLAPPEALQALAGELTAHCDDWQVLGFGHTGHAFTNPEAQNAAGGMMYSSRANARAWTALTGFLAETLV